MKSYLFSPFSVTLSLFVFAIAPVTTPASGGSADLWQARNGTPAAPSDPVDWVKGNVGAANSHYVEGYSIPYRIVITGLSTGYHNLLIEWDSKQAGKQTIDYITHYNRLLPHNQFFDHTQAEAIQPLDGVSGSFSDSNSFPIPTPSTLGTPVPGQPAASFNALPPSQRVMTIWNGMITNLSYPVEGSLSNDTAVTRLSIDFIATDSTVVIAWGGHIASQLDWGAGNSAVSINGSPYHTRKISLDGGGGNQDRSLQAQAVIVPFSCDVAGPVLTCPGNIDTYQALADTTNSNKTFRWSLVSNTSSALIVGPTNGSSVQVKAGHNGSYTVQVIIGAGGAISTCRRDVAVVDTTPPLLTCSSNLTADCAGPQGVTVFFSAAASDDCDTNVQIVCRPLSGAAFPTGVHTVICAATDLSGNSNQCQFTITIRDPAPPQIVCPADNISPENPPDSGAALVSFPLPVVADICDANALVICAPPSGSTFPVGVNIVTCTATDNAGNTNACSFTVKVIPHRLTASSTDDSGPGTLRQALLDANDSPAPNLIVFNFSGSGPHTIDLLSPLPALADEVFIDGWSQPGFSGAPTIALNGTGIDPTADGLVITGGNSTVRGLALYGFANAIRLEGTGNNVIQGNHIGTDPTGSNPLGNAANGILIQSPGNLIGGTVSGDANRIAFNAANGVSVEPSAGAGNAIHGNAIYSNILLGIDLGGDGVTANDVGDSDTGPNQYQNFPVLTSAHCFDGVTITIEGTIHSTANSLLRIEFFGNRAADATGFGEGQIFLGTTTVTTDVSGNGHFFAGFPLLTPANYITATATDEANNSSEFSEAVRFISPPFITQQPIGTTVPLGTPVTLCVTAIGTEPLIYQWRLNGANVPGATNPCLTFSSVDLTNGGSYTVIVANEFGTVSSEAAALLLMLPTLAGADNFVDRVALDGTNGLVAGGNSGASIEPGEPLHAGKMGGRSVWYTWRAPVTGIATFRTRGSTFDTLLAVYTGTSVDDLVAVASDEDLGGFFTSGVRFNAIVGTRYHIAIDGFGGVGGDFVFGWEEEDTPHLLAKIRGQPASQTVAAGDDAMFTVDAVRVCGHGHQDCPDPGEFPGGQIPLLTYQWFFNGNLIDGATNETHTVINVQPDTLGNYTVQVTVQYQTQPRTIESLPASLQINLTGDTVQNVLATDKFLDTANAPESIILGGGTVPPAPAAAEEGTLRAESVAASTVVRGYTGSQVFNTAGSATEAGEEPICGVMGGASQWISFVALESGTLHLNTEGSSYDTVVAVFIRSPTNATKLQQLRCDNNSGRDGRDSKLDVSVQAGKTNFIVIDGVNSATGVLQLNYSLVTATTLSPLGVSTQGTYKLRVNGHPAMRFTIQRSSDFVNWTSIFTTNSTTSTFDFTDLDSSSDPRFYYRALMLPQP